MWTKESGGGMLNRLGFVDVVAQRRVRKRDGWKDEKQWQESGDVACERSKRVAVPEVAKENIRAIRHSTG
jgi:16S rRNA U1498 N3-methylase RsmE